MKTTHGYAGTPTYQAWANLKKSKRDMCKEWLNFAEFLKDMGEKPHRYAGVRRKDETAPYSKENCAWVQRSTWAVGANSPGFLHGKSRSRIYNTWLSMIKRTTNPKERIYKYYGGRGITVCPKWLTFAGFYEDMGDRPEGCSLDRLDNDKGYDKENCRWATRLQQVRNQRRTIRVTVNGETMPLAELADRMALPYRKLYTAYRNGKLSKLTGEEA